MPFLLDMGNTNVIVLLFIYYVNFNHQLNIDYIIFNSSIQKAKFACSSCFMANLKCPFSLKVAPFVYLQCPPHFMIELSALFLAEGNTTIINKIKFFKTVM